MGRRAAVQFAQHRFQFVPAVTVQQHDLANARPHQRFDQVADDRAERGRIEVHGEGELRLIGLRAVGKRRQQHDLRAAAMGLFANLLAHRSALDRVHTVGQVEVVRLGGAEGQHGHFVVPLLHFAIVRFGQFPGRHGRVGIGDQGLGIGD